MARLSAGARPESREIVELRALAERQPELAAAAALQIALLDALRRVEVRVATSSIALSADDVAARLARGQRLIDFEQLPIDWTEVRLLFRQITEALRRHEALEPEAAARLLELGRSDRLPELARRWFDEGACDASIEMLDEVLTWSLRPFLRRTADVLRARTGFDQWRRGTCPLCGGAPDFAAIAAGGQRRLICGRCHTTWPVDALACPFCGERDAGRITSLATAGGPYRVAACTSCGRYLKAIDTRRAGRAVIPAVDAIATLPLDAVILRRGFTNG